MQFLPFGFNSLSKFNHFTKYQTFFIVIYQYKIYRLKYNKVKKLLNILNYQFFKIDIKLIENKMKKANLLTNESYRKFYNFGIIRLEICNAQYITIK